MDIDIDFNMNLEKYIFKQVFQTSFLFLFGLITVIWLNQAISILEVFFYKGSNISEFIVLSLFPLPLWIMVAMPMSVFIGILWVIFKLLSDRELLVMQALGKSPVQFSIIPILFSFFVSIFLYINSIYILPYSFSEFKKTQFSIRSAIPKILIQNNVFIDIANGLTIYVGNRINDNELRQVFIQDSRNKEKIITYTSESGIFDIKDGNPTLILKNGQRTELGENGDASALLSFSTHTINISKKNSISNFQKVIDVNEDSISNLLDPSKSISKKYIGERFAMGHYRILSPLMPICLALIACVIMLHGRVLRDKVGIKIFVSSICGICFQSLFILSRSITASNPSLWFVMYLSIIIPCIIFVLILFYPNITNYFIKIIYEKFEKKFKEKLS